MEKDKQQKGKLVLNMHKHVDYISGKCPTCGVMVTQFGKTNYCSVCGTKLVWSEEEWQKQFTC